MTAVVQSVQTYAANSGGLASGGITFGSAVTVGNLLIVLASVRDNGGAPAAAAGWNLDGNTFHGASNGEYYQVYYRYAQAGDGTTFTYDSTSRWSYRSVAFEISGVTGVYATDVASVHGNGQDLSTGNYPFTTGSFTTANANALVLFYSGNGTGTNSFPTYSGSGTGTANVDQNVDQHVVGTWFGGDLWGNNFGSHELVSASGSTVQVTMSGGPNGSFAGHLFVEFKPRASSTETVQVDLAIVNPQLNAGVGREETTSATIGIVGMKFNVPVVVAKSANVDLAIANPQLAAIVADLSVIPKLRQFNTFG